MKILSEFKSKIFRGDGVGYFLVLPYFAHFSLFVAFPVIFCLVLVFHKWDIVSEMQWVGMNNFSRVFQDKLFFKAIGNTLTFLVVHIP